MTFGTVLTSSVLFEPSDIVIPGANSTTDVQARIGAGESIHVIKGSKGTFRNVFLRFLLQ